MIASRLRLTVNDMAKLRLKDAYSVHRVVYDLFEKTREDGSCESSGILYADLGGKYGECTILIVSDRSPNKTPTYGTIESKPVPESFLNHHAYRFEIIINPVKRDSKTRKLVPVLGEEQLIRWFCDKAPSWGFTVDASSVLIRDVVADIFKKNDNCVVTLARATVTGVLCVTDKVKFQKSFCQGVGKGKTFGCGMLQLVPTNTNN